MLGGMSWESTATYYKLINEDVKNTLGGLHSAKIVLSSVDFDEIEKLQHKALWEDTAKILADEAKAIENAKADFLIICTNTMHKVALDIEQNINISILHIADCTAQALVEDGVQSVALLGTKFTMSEEFYKGRIEDKFNIKVLIPSEEEQDIIHKVIYEELCLGICKETSKNEYIKIIKNLEKEGAQGVILGCTEISMLIEQKDVDIKVYDTTKLHAIAAVKEALK